MGVVLETIPIVGQAINLKFKSPSRANIERTPPSSCSQETMIPDTNVHAIQTPRRPY